jgi:hypothetical protein
LQQKAELVQRHFADVVELNAPSLRYNVVLEELQQEVKRTNTQAKVPLPQWSGQKLLPISDGLEATLAPATAEQSFLSNETLSPLDGFDDFPLDPDLWSQLDAFPFCESVQLAFCDANELIPVNSRHSFQWRVEIDREIES